MATNSSKKDQAAKGAVKDQAQVKTSKGEEKKAQVTKAACPCGCGDVAVGKGLFIPGHDGRISGWFRQLEAGKKKVEELPAVTRKVWDVWNKLGKPGGKHPHVKQAALQAVAS